MKMNKVVFNILQQKGKVVKEYGKWWYCGEEVEIC
jgi:hypothetical protein